MFTIILLTIGMIFTSWNSPRSTLFSCSISQSSILFLMSSLLLSSGYWESKWCFFSWSLCLDSLSLPLIILSCWLIPVVILASISSLSPTPTFSIRIFLSYLFFILLALLFTFSSSNLMMFFIGFEATMIPTLLLMSRWGAQRERMEAGYYFIFYTLISSLPLLLGLMFLYKTKSHLNLMIFSINKNITKKEFLAIFCLGAFLVKVPIFGFHLWLPKAHVEAPVAGSMILAAILLKMGGYGFIRLSSIFLMPFLNNMAPMLLPFCCWGGCLASLICLSQTDLKSLMAYSSVSHMSFMMAGLSSFSNWGMTGGMFMMISHGIVSSALFSLANIVYERTKTRSLMINRGLKSSFFLLPLFWLMFAVSNLSLPPFPKSMGELFLFSSILSMSATYWMFLLLGVVLTSIFSLSIFQLINTGTLFKWCHKKLKMSEREYLMLFLHLMPLILLILNPNLLSMWFV